jgi:hypothetical protein
MGFLSKLRVAVWGQPPETKEESHLLLKVDFFVLTYVCLMYWVNYLDRANLNNAYVSGAQQDLHFKGGYTTRGKHFAFQILSRRTHVFVLSYSPFFDLISYESIKQRVP